jgi:chorismate dehydratase
MSILRLATVPYVNAEPLTWGFLKGPYREICSVSPVPPARIPDLLRDGRADVGLIPSIEYQRLEGVELLPDVCIASKSRARSVFLASRVPLEKVRRIALDPGSRTSAALLRIILAHRGRRDVVYAEQDPPLAEMLREHDAAMLIGDAALAADTAGLRVFDLAAEWHGITGLPFVFALWAARQGVAIPDGARPFLESRQMGVANIGAIAAAAAPRLRLEARTIEEYLRVNIHYHLGSEEARGLDLFFRQAHELGLIPVRRPARFREPPAPEPARAGGDGG